MVDPTRVSSGVQCIWSRHQSANRATEARAVPQGARSAARHVGSIWLRRLDVSEVLPFIDIYLVATGIERTCADEATVTFYREAGMDTPVDVGHLDAAKVKELAEMIHTFTP